MTETRESAFDGLLGSDLAAGYPDQVLHGLKGNRQPFKLLLRDGVVYRKHSNL